MRPTTIFSVLTVCAVIALPVDCRSATTNPPTWTVRENAEWRAVDSSATSIAPGRQLRVITPRLEGACLDPETAPGRVALGQLTIDSTSVPASVTAIAVDDRPLAESRRILLVYATDALNSGMTFTGPERETLVALGQPPILLRTGRLKATLTGHHVAGMKLWALGLDGRRREAMGAVANGDTLSVAIDTSRLKRATPFFEAVED